MLKTILLAAMLVMNVLAFAAMGLDKRRARKGAWRVKERTLFLLTALMGGLGGVAGMFFFHHKTKHWYFRVFFPVLLAAQVVLLLAVWPRLP